MSHPGSIFSNCTQTGTLARRESISRRGKKLNGFSFWPATPFGWELPGRKQASGLQGFAFALNLETSETLKL
jgi:hypothetical protein